MMAMVGPGRIVAIITEMPMNPNMIPQIHAMSWALSSCAIRV